MKDGVYINGEWVASAAKINTSTDRVLTKEDLQEMLSQMDKAQESLKAGRCSIAQAALEMGAGLLPCEYLQDHQVMVSPGVYEAAKKIVEESAQSTPEPAVQERPWVREHDRPATPGNPNNPKWHFFPEEYGKALCGREPISGTPFVSGEIPAYLTEICRACLDLYLSNQK